MEGLDCYLSLNYVPCPWTLVNGVEKLPPGCWYEWHDGQVRTESYWQLPALAPRVRDLESAKQELDFLLQQSVREHLLSDVPLGVWLSGGVDSSTILHYAASTNHARLKTFSISFHGRSFDETEHIQRVVSHYGTDHEQLDLNPQEDLQGAIEQFAYYSDEPSADAGALAGVVSLPHVQDARHRGLERRRARMRSSPDTLPIAPTSLPRTARTMPAPRHQAGARRLALLARLR